MVVELNSKALRVARMILLKRSKNVFVGEFCFSSPKNNHVKLIISTLARQNE